MHRKIMGLNEHLEIQVRDPHTSLSLLKGRGLATIKTRCPKQVKHLGSKLFAKPFSVFQAPALWTSLVLLVPTFTALIGAGASWGEKLICCDKQGQLLLPVYVTTPRSSRLTPLLLLGWVWGKGYLKNILFCWFEMEFFFF